MTAGKAHPNEHDKCERGEDENDCSNNAYHDDVALCDVVCGGEGHGRRMVE